MKKDLTEIVFILDRSGSMAGLEGDTIGGFNAMLQRQKEAPGEALVTTILFNSHTSVLHDRVNLQSVAPMTPQDYTVGGCTALLDAVGNAIGHIQNIHKYARPEDVPEKTLFVITTDGYENSSRDYTYPRLKGLIGQQQNRGWEFLFLGANIDAAKEAESMGIPRECAADYHADQKGTAVLFEAVGEAICCARTNGAVSATWKRRVSEDFQKRKRK